MKDRLLQTILNPCPGDWVKSLCWKPEFFREDSEKVSSFLVPATGLSRFVGNSSSSLEYVPKHIAFVPATGLSRFVGNVKVVNILFDLVKSRRLG